MIYTTTLGENIKCEFEGSVSSLMSEWVCMTGVLVETLQKKLKDDVDFYVLAGMYFKSKLEEIKNECE